MERNPFLLSEIPEAAASLFPVWDFEGCELKSRWEIGCAVVRIVYHHSNGLLATTTDDLVIRLFDAVALRMVRKFEGHIYHVTDLCFSKDGEWLLTSSMDEDDESLKLKLGGGLSSIEEPVFRTSKRARSGSPGSSCYPRVVSREAIRESH
ncbi:hypothetical protein PVL29_020779 [Vitis rotundifolia]|uniref:Uncharacterized protein n=1 Tax=Vitis rotundifolia TaxID=103349 RepID=A0AA38YY15_VITRO|nr:hypothetical protein PVL29_020779 [Vitis rotundifolia]